MTLEQLLSHTSGLEIDDHSRAQRLRLHLYKNDFYKKQKQKKVENIFT